MEEILNFAIKMMQINMNIFGFNISLWGLFLFHGIAGIILVFIFRIFK